jgi:NADH:ubiquinone oxidoreductase subunit F (NADH-binding)/(2Fe-2S) ferredoxin
MPKTYVFTWEPGEKKQKDIYSRILKLVNEKQLKDVEVYASKFIGITRETPVIRILPDNVIYTGFGPADTEAIMSAHLIERKPLQQFLFNYTFENLNVEGFDPHSRQYRIVLRNSGYINPDSIDDYIMREGYAALSRVLSSLTPDQVIAEVKKSGLRGRGGAGFPTGIKWSLTKDAEADQKYVICNADEGDPGAYMDRSVLEGDPHSVLEGMAIAGYTVGATQGYIYIRAEYPLAIKRLETAIAAAKDKGLLGGNILGSKFSFDIELRLGAGAFVCGEETALIASIEGKRGMPKTRPPFPAASGLWGKPTVINNVETWANIAPILLKGADWFAAIGSEHSKGTKVFALTGKIKNPGLIEVPMGTMLRDIVYDIGGGTLGGKKLKAVQTGGPSGGVIPAEHVDIKVDYENLQKIGSIMGSGGMIVMDETDCIIDVVKFYLQFAVDESCGKCSPCRIGGKQLLRLLDKITEGKGEIKDLKHMKKIAMAMQKASLCGLGQSTPNPVVSTMKYFEHEYLDHIQAKSCGAGKCKNLMLYLIREKNCIGCGACANKCPVNAIAGEKKKPYFIHQEKCIKCGACFDVCKFNAVYKGGPKNVNA